MKLNVCKEITFIHVFIDLTDKTIASLQPIVSPGRYNVCYKQTRLSLKTVQPNGISKHLYCHPFQS